MSKYSIEDIKLLPNKKLLALIQIGKDFLKNHPVMLEILKEHGYEPEIIDLIPVRFKDLDVSAKTLNGIVYLNYKLLSDGDFFKDLSYLVHEFTHYMQQTHKPTKSSDDGKYLDNGFEQEAFQNQIEYLSEEFGELAANEYIDNLLDYHKVNGKERKEKEDMLSAKL